MSWAWDQDKDAINPKKHGLPLSIGEVALADPLALSIPDPHPQGADGMPCARVSERPPDTKERRMRMARTRTCLI